MSFLKRIAAIASVTMFLGAAPALAVPLPQAAFQQEPDIASNLSSVEYDRSSGLFTATGNSFLFNQGGGLLTFLGGVFSLTVNDLVVTQGGSPDPAFGFSGGSFSITDSGGGTVLSSSTLVAMGSDGGVGTGQIQFLFRNLQGTGAPVYQAKTDTALGLLNSIIFTGNGDAFQSDISISGPAAGNVDVAGVPLPASAWLLLSALGGLGGLRWLKRRRETVAA